MIYRMVCFILLLSPLIATAAPTTPGSCNISNLRTEFVGKGIIYGAKTTSGNQHQGEIWLLFDYVCKPWTNTTNMFFATQNLHSSYGGGVAYRTNTWGVVLQSKIPFSNVFKQNYNIIFRKFDKNEIGADGLLSGSLRVELFDVDKNGTVGGGAGGTFPAGVNRQLTTINKFDIIFSDGKSKKFIISNYKLPTNIRIYDPTCSVSAPTNIDVGELSLGHEKQQNFQINISCSDAVTIQSKVSTKFSNASSDVVKDPSGYIFTYSNDGVEVDMSIQDALGNPVLFDTFQDTQILDPDISSYNINYVAKITPLPSSSFGNFSFIVTYEVEYH